MEHSGHPSSTLPYLYPTLPRLKHLPSSGEIRTQVEWERGGEVTEGLADHRPHGMMESGSEELLCGIYFGDREGANSPPFRENHMGSMILE